MMKGKILFWLLVVIFIPLTTYFMINVEEVQLLAKLVVFVPVALIIAAQGFVVYHFSNGVRFNGGEVIIPKMFGDLRLEMDQIRGYRARKSYFGVVLDYSSLTVSMKNGDAHSITVPDAIVDQLKSESMSENA